MKFKGRWLPESEAYKDACIRLSKDLSNFKQDPVYIGYVGNDNRPASVVDAFDKVVGWEYISDNDRIGNPKLHNGKSAGTLRFMKVIEYLMHEVGALTIFDSILEIGGGYGGQCLVAKSMTSFRYTIIDIPEALELSKAYLKENDIECTFISSENVPLYPKGRQPKVLISDYCISELDNTGIDFYLNRIKAKYCYITCNSQGKRREYLINKLSERYELTITPERPKTSHHENIIIYGVANNNLR